MAVTALTEPRAALAEPPAPAPVAPLDSSSAPSTPSEQSALAVKLTLGASGFDASTTRAAISRELGIPVAEATADATPSAWLEVRLEGADRATVNYCTIDGRCVGRSIALPAQRERALETIALLAANVARNEAAELIEALERRTAAAQASAAGNEPPPAPPSPSQTAAATATTRATGSAAAAEAPRKKALLDEEPGVNLSLWHPIAILPDSERRRLHLELGLGYSRAGALRGVGVNALFARVDQEVEGALIAGLGAWAGGDSQGLIVGGLGALTQGKLQGAEIAGLVSLHLGHGSGPYGVNAWSGASLAGMQSAGLWNHSAGSVVGAQYAGGMNTLLGSLEGMQAAGGLNWATGDVQGLQAAGALNWVDGHVQGLQAAGALNWVDGHVQGLQAAGGLNWVGGNVVGLQAAPLNLTRGSMTGLAAGAVNVAGLGSSGASGRGLEASVVNVDRSTFHGLQVGVVNVSGRHRGAQIGLVNVSDELDGVPIGLVNLGGNTDPSLVAFATNRTPLNLGAKFVTGYTFSMVSFGYDPKGTSQGNAHEVLQSAFQFGGHIPFATHGAIEPSLGYAYETYTNELNASVNGGHVVLYRVSATWHLIPELGVFAGGGARQLINHVGDVNAEAEGFGGVEVF